MRLKLNDWIIPCTSARQLDYNLYEIITNSDIAYTHTWAWLTESRIIERSISSFIDTKVSGEIDMEQYNFTFNGSIESINYFYDFKTYTIIIRLIREALNINV